MCRIFEKIQNFVRAFDNFGGKFWEVLKIKNLSSKIEKFSKKSQNQNANYFKPKLKF